VLPAAADVHSQVKPPAKAWCAHNVDTLPRPGRRWVVLGGDSMSQSIGASAYNGRWVGQLAARLATTGNELRGVNLSATGERVADLPSPQLPALDQLGSRDDDLVTVLAGSNDLFGARACRQSLPGAFAELVDRVPPGSVVATLPQPTGAAGRANQHVERAARAGPIVMDLQVTNPRPWRRRLAGDFFHPNDAGYAAVATAFEPTLGEVLA